MSPPTTLTTTTIAAEGEDDDDAVPSRPLDASTMEEEEKHDDDDDVVADTQDSQQSQELTQNELTQLADFDDDDMTQGLTPPSQSSQMPQSPPAVDPLTIPWGRLIPCSRHGSGSGGGDRDDGGGGRAAATARKGQGRDEGGTFGTTTLVGSGGGLDLLPRDPKEASKAKAAARDTTVPPVPTSSGYAFLGLSDLKPSDRFNEYVLGRSQKCDVVSTNRPTAVTDATQQQPQPQGEADAKEEKNRKDKKKNDWVHAMISNRHCRIFCLLKDGTAPPPPPKSGGAPPNGDAARSDDRDCDLDMEVYVEDTSGNGTLINNTTLLRRGERRILHTGDEICLINPATLHRRVRSGHEREDIRRHYSYIFVNVHRQQRRGNGGGGGSDRWGSTIGGAGSGLGAGIGLSMECELRGAEQQKEEEEGAEASRRHRTTDNEGEGAKKRKGMVDVKATNSKTPDDERTGVPLHHPEGAAPAESSSGAAEPRPGRPPASSRAAAPRRTSPRTPALPRQRRVEEDYDLRDLLGTGTCGEVRRAIHRRTGVQRAIKIISLTNRNLSVKSRLLDTDASIRAEAAILRTLDHPYITRLVDVYLHPGTAVYLVMEMLTGGDLFDRIVDKGRYTEIEARRITRRMLSAVHYLHEERDIVHRDLKPENILCVNRSSDVDVKITDFGLAKSVTNGEGLKTFCGTPQYFAPEVLRRRNTVAGRGRYGKEADMWSLGVVLYILLCGAPPFDVSSDGIDVVASAKVEFRGDKWKNVSSRAKDLVRRLLQQDPRKRLSVVGACDHEWIAMDDGDTHRHPLDDPRVLAHAKRTSANPTNGDATRGLRAAGRERDDANGGGAPKRRRVDPTHQPIVANGRGGGPGTASELPTGSRSSPYKQPPRHFDQPQSIVNSPSPNKRPLFHEEAATTAAGGSSTTTSPNDKDLLDMPPPPAPAPCKATVVRTKGNASDDASSRGESAPLPSKSKPDGAADDDAEKTTGPSSSTDPPGGADGSEPSGTRPKAASASSSSSPPPARANETGTDRSGAAALGRRRPPRGAPRAIVLSAAPRRRPAADDRAAVTPTQLFDDSSSSSSSPPLPSKSARKGGRKRRRRRTLPRGGGAAPAKDGTATENKPPRPSLPVELTDDELLSDFSDAEEDDREGQGGDGVGEPNSDEAETIDDDDDEEEEEIDDPRGGPPRPVSTDANEPDRRSPPPAGRRTEGPRAGGGLERRSSSTSSSSIGTKELESRKEEEEGGRRRREPKGKRRRNDDESEEHDDAAAEATTKALDDGPTPKRRKGVQSTLTEKTLPPQEEEGSAGVAGRDDDAGPPDEPTAPPAAAAPPNADDRETGAPKNKSDFDGGARSKDANAPPDKRGGDDGRGGTQPSRGGGRRQTTLSSWFKKR